jgi:GTP-binding protein
VAVLGRPNVGKSTLFNRLLGRQRAITDPTPGVTRDVLEGELDLGGPRVRLLDTGGYTLERGQLEREVARRSLAIAASSDLTLALVEAGGLTREDQALFDRLRRLPDFPDRVVLVINKVDGPKQEQALGEFQGLGFGSQAAVSAAHGRGIGELKKLIQQRLQAAGCARLQQASLPGSAAGLRAEAAVPEQEADLAAQAAAGGEGGPASWAGAEVRLAIIGKPNTGKSTLLNRLLGQERALVTESPGTTRDPVGGTLRYRGRSLRVLDTAGIRRRSRVSEAVEYYSVQRAIRSIEEADLVVLLMDVREGVSEQDKKIAALAAGAGRGVILALNKVDLLEGGEGRPGRAAEGRPAGHRTEGALRLSPARFRSPGDAVRGHRLGGGAPAGRGPGGRPAAASPRVHRQAEPGGEALGGGVRPAGSGQEREDPLRHPDRGQPRAFCLLRQFPAAVPRALHQVSEEPHPRGPGLRQGAGGHPPARVLKERGRGQWAGISPSARSPTCWA